MMIVNYKSKEGTLILIVNVIIFTLFCFFRFVDSEIINILRQRMEDCVMYEGTNQEEACKGLRDNYDAASENFFSKCKI